MHRMLFAVGLALGAAGAAHPLRADDVLPRLEQAVKAVTPSVLEWRQDFHAHPELSNREERTARVVAELLRQFGVDELKTGVARHGVVALIRGHQPGPTVALRADMDALPIQEQTGLPFASRNPGMMHACGHDAHTAMLLGAAKALCGLREAMPGNVKLIFQPSEEGAPAGERGGAAVMVEQGVLHDPDVAAIFGLHVNTELATGKIGYRPGTIMAAVDRFRITVTGRQSHASSPWQGIDPVVVSAHIVVALQTIVSRKVDAREPAVVSVGVIQGGRAWNIIPQTVELEGTVRTHNADVRHQIAEHFRRIVEQTAAAHGAAATITGFEDYAPAVWNDPELSRRMKPTLDRAAGQENVVEIQPMMGGEDFARYAEKVPGLYVMLGVRNEASGAIWPLHTPKMTLDEAALPLGVRTFCLLALDYLNRPADNALIRQESGASLAVR